MFAAQRSALWVSAAGVLCLTPLIGCSFWGGQDYYEQRTAVLETQTHTGGEELAQRKQNMRRAHHDLLSIQSTLQGLRRHRSFEDIRLFKPFAYAYLRHHVHPLISDPRSSWHPELVPLDANLLFAEAAVLVELRDRWRFERLVEEIERRFGDMQSLLVEFPAGTQSTVEQGLHELKSRRWRI